MIDLWLIAGTFIAGGSMGALYFLGLWWTARHAFAAANPAPWFLISMVLRTGLLLLGFHLFAKGSSLRLLICLLGFVTARWLVTRRLQPLREALRAPQS